MRHVAHAFAQAGYRVIGVDISAAMIELARQRVPAAEFHVASFLDFQLPACSAITAIKLHAQTLQLADLPVAERQRSVEFVLQQQKCEQISRVLVNDVVECSSAEEQNMTQDCFSALRTSNRAEIEFGV